MDEQYSQIKWVFLIEVNNLIGDNEDDDEPEIGKYNTSNTFTNMLVNLINKL